MKESLNNTFRSFKQNWKPLTNILANLKEVWKNRKESYVHEATLDSKEKQKDGENFGIVSWKRASEKRGQRNKQ